MLDYYDWLVASIPVLLVLGATVSLHPSVALHEGLAAGSVFAGVVVYEMLFRNPPVEVGAVEAAAVSIWGLGFAASVSLLVL